MAGKRIGLFFGTFNPIHMGHLIIANYMLEFCPIDELWFVVSPQSPFKKHQTLADDRHRLEMVNLAIGDTVHYRATDIEFYMPKPSYTIDTVAYLYDRYPGKKFSIIMGADNLETFHKWKNFEKLLELCPVLVYPRPGHSLSNSLVKGDIAIVDAPLMEISSSFIRKSIAEGKDIRFFLPSEVWNYIQKIGLYRQR